MSKTKHRKTRGQKIKMLLAACVMALTMSCVGVKYVTIEQYAPPKYLFPPDAKSLAVLNNVDSANIYIINPYIDVWSVDGDSVMQYVAQAFADSELFSEVVVLDSCIFPKGDTIAHLLTKLDVAELCEYLQTDMLFTCDFGGISRNNPDIYYNEEGKYYLLAHVYAPTRTDPIYLMNVEGLLDMSIATREDKEKAEQKAFPLIGNAGVKNFTPRWDLRERSFYAGKAYDLREATICVKEDNWDGAYAFWDKYGKKKNKRHKLISCYNKALYYEMQDSIDKSFELLKEAKTYASDTTAVDSTLLKNWEASSAYYGDAGEYPYTDYQRICNYERILTERKAEILKLNLLKE